MPNSANKDALPESYDTLIAINLVCCTMSLVGAVVMIVPFFLSRQLRKIRHQLILGLAVNDGMHALTVLVPSVYSHLTGPMPANTTGGKIDAFLYLSLVVSGSLWALSIAASTYTTLVLPLSMAARALHRPRIMLVIWAFIWLISIVNSTIGVSLYSVIDVSGFYFFPSAPPNIYGNLVIFIPRTTAFLFIVLIYVRLFLFFRRQTTKHHKVESDPLNTHGSLVNSATHIRYVSLDGTAAPLDLRDFQIEANIATPGTDNASESDSVLHSPPFSSKFWQGNFGRKGSKDSQNTLVDVAMTRVGVRLPTTVNVPDLATDENDAVKKPAHMEVTPEIDLEISRQTTASETSTFDTAATTLPVDARKTKSEGCASNRIYDQGHYRTCTDQSQASKVINLADALAFLRPASLVAEGLPSPAAPARQQHHPVPLTASEENRRVSHLMMLYPAAYSVLIGFSVGRVLTVLITGNRSSAAMNILNRISVLSMGAVDAIIYTIIEWRFRASSKVSTRS